MSESPRLDPALSADDWKHVAKYGIDYLRAEAGPQMWWNGDDGPKAILALANAALPDDSPYKFTRADVALLLELAECVEMEAGDDWRADGPPLRRLAAKLAALLPPEESTT